MLKIQGLNFSYVNQSTPLFRDFNLTVQSGELVTLCGPNGCGKSTLLELIAGLIPMHTGTITYQQKPVRECTIGFVFQNYREALFPWLTIKENIGLPLVLKKIPHDQIEKKILELHTALAPTLPLTAYPPELSGGQQQLASILRALVIDPDIFLLDEPFASLDYETTLELRQQLLHIWKTKKITTLLVSHNIDEALYLSQKIIVFSKKPTSALATYTNPLPFPRQFDHPNTTESARLKQQILNIFTNNTI